MIKSKRNSLVLLFHNLMKTKDLEIYKNIKIFYLKTFFEFNKKKFISKNNLGLIFLISQRIVIKKKFLC